MVDFPLSTAEKMRSVVHKILYEAGYIRKLSTWELQRIDIDSEVIDYLKENHENYVLKCIQL